MEEVAQTAVPDHQRKGWRGIVNRHYAGPLALVSFGVWLHAADGLMVATLMPDIVADIGGTRLIAWSIALYELGSIVAGAASALLVLRHGLRTTMSLAALLYAFGCAVSAASPEMPVMLAGRLAQGFGGGGLVALAFVAADRLFPRQLMPHVIAAVSGLWGLSAFLGPLVGGLFAQWGAWRGAFWFFAAQAVLLAACIAFGLRGRSGGSESAEGGRLPLARLAVLSCAVLLIAAAGIEVSPVRSPLLVIAGLLVLRAFTWMDARRDANRLLPPSPFDLRNGVGAALVMVMSFGAATIAIGIYGPLLMVNLHGVSPLVAGYVIATVSIGWSIMAVLVAGADERHDGKLIVTGMALLAASIVGFMFAVPNGPIWLIVVFATAEGAGFGMAWTFILRRVTALAPDGERERVASALPTVHRLGYAMGAAYIGIVANFVGVTDDFDRQVAQTVGFWIFAASLPLAALGLVATWSFVRSRARPAGSAVSTETMR